MDASTSDARQPGVCGQPDPNTRVSIRCQIGAELVVEPSAIKSHVASLLAKLGLRHRSKPSSSPCEG
jgi:hypothetical protein